MKNLIVLALVCAAPVATAATEQLRGSDTLAGVVTDAITQGGFSDRLTYLGGGSGLGEAALVNGEQGIAPMSRAFATDKLAAEKAKGITPIDHVIGLDGVGLWVNAQNQTPGVTLATLRQIFGCTLTKWEQVPGSGLTGDIKVFRRNDDSGTTDTFKNLVGVTKFGPCVTVVAETDDIANAAVNNIDAIGYAGLSAKRDGDRPLAIGKDEHAAPMLPTVANIRSFSYPLARQLHVYEATGAQTLNADERALLDKMLDRSFLDPILQDHDFITLD